jgi:hypothetical protein
VEELLDYSEKKWLNDFNYAMVNRLAPHLTEQEKLWLLLDAAPFKY